ncbi:MAG: hypothetical protein QME79_10335 [Bacillota bacterium]|nr:hypothetical protein [Bacillota bacterium]
MTGWWGRLVRASAGSLATWLIFALLHATPVQAGDLGRIFQRDPVTGAWVRLPSVNDLAVLTSTGAPAGGACNNQNRPTLFTNRVKVEMSVSKLSVPTLASPDELGARPVDLTSPELGTTSSEVTFVEDFQPRSPAISLQPAQYGYLAGFRVPEDLRVEWQVVLTVKNNLDGEITGLTVTEHLNAELDYHPDTVSVTSGLPAPVFERSGNLKVTWTIPGLGPGAEARLSFTIYSRLRNAHQQYSEPTPPEGPPYFLNSGATLKYYRLGVKSSLELPAIPVWVEEGGYLRVSLSATRYDWQVRKPGTFAADPVEIGVYSNRKVSVIFSGFADLAAVSPGHTGAIPTFYGFGNTLDEVENTGWIRAQDLNVRRLETAAAESGTTAVWKLWPKLKVSGRERAGEYEDVGCLTFILCETSAYIETQDTLLRTSLLEGVNLPDPDRL